MSNPYYQSGEVLRAKNLAAGGAALSLPAFAFSHLDLVDTERALDAGCGWGRFVLPLLERAPSLTRLCCTDIWPGAVASCRSTVQGAGWTATYAAADIRSLPFDRSSFDLVMANHMLYELDDVHAALVEVGRVLRGDGRLLATTYSDAGPVPMTELHNLTLQHIGHRVAPPRPSSFSLENGTALLHEVFDEVTSHVLVEPRTVTDPVDFRDEYLLTGGYHWASREPAIPGEARRRIADVFLRLATERIASDGSITWDTRWTAFVARGPRTEPLVRRLATS